MGNGGGHDGIGDYPGDTEMNVCTWSQDEDGAWETACGEMFCMVDGTPSDNHMAYCCYCGLSLKEKAYPEGGLK
jgi:hypothetical protein